MLKNHGMGGIFSTEVWMIPGRDNAYMRIDTILNSLAAEPADFVPGYVAWGIIRAQGIDTVKFLQGQLTQDVALMGVSEARLAAWCSAKGRMLASFIVVKNTSDDILLLCSADVLPATLKRLQMFVLRAQCKLTDATQAFELRGLAGDAVPDAMHSVAARAHSTLASGLFVSRNDAQVTVALPPGYHGGAALPRALQLVPLGSQPADLGGAKPDQQALAQWQYLEVTSGIARITAPVADAFVPQMLNYESVGGVNFKKGCYPGQEVVARSQFRGSLKRRAFVVHADVPLAVGAEVFNSADADQPCGTVAAGAPVPDSDTRFAGIVSMQVAASQAGSVHLGSATGPALALQALPYALLADI